MSNLYFSLALFGTSILAGFLGAMTGLGGIGHTLPFMFRDFRLALWAAGAVGVAELGVITWIRHRYMDSPWISAALQVGLGGVLVFITGVLIGSS